MLKLPLEQIYDFIGYLEAYLLDYIQSLQLQLYTQQ